jgi:hypothetical protein
MPAALNNLDSISGKLIHKAVAVVNPPTVKASQVSPQRFGLADTVVPVSLNIL